uniref:Hexosyltransferase n=1 Tax=Neogobius melanostomus TaxID=47308 RepID=A0A8C6T7D5_9GOBI
MEGCKGKGRKEEVVHSRLRLGHTGFRKTLFLMGKVESENCDMCDVPESVEHVLMECRKYERQRRILRDRMHELERKKCERNISAANISGFSTLPAHTQDFLYYRHCRHFPYSSQVFLFFVIKSSPGNYERREVLRKTWARERQHNGLWIRRIFISGTAGSGVEKMRLNKLLQVNDILQWDFADSFFNLTHKQILFLEWMERNCPNTRFLLNGDDDVFANTDNMVEYLHGLTDNDGGKHLFIGHLIQYRVPIRSPGNKYFVPVQVHESNSYPPYCGGGGSMAAGFIYDMSKSITLLPIDDVYMGMCLAKAVCDSGLKPESHMWMKTPCFYKEVLVVHRFLPLQMFLMWHRIQNPELDCSSSFKVL